MRIAILEIGHWHAGGCLKTLREVGETVCAVSDRDPATAERSAAQIGCPSYTDYVELLERERPDFVFAYGMHCEMTAIARALVERDIPFQMEKPMGVHWADLEPVAEEVRKRGLFAAVCLPYRRSPLIRRLAQLRDAGELGAITTSHHRLFAGEPARYQRWNVPWVLDPQQAGGGPLFNFGPHVIDIFLYLTAEPVRSVFCRASRLLHHLEIEDFATLSVESGSGCIGTMEVGYVCPNERYEHRFSISTARLFVESTDLDGGTIRWRDGREEIVGQDTEQTYPSYFADTLDRFREGQPPHATIDDMVAALRTINAAVESAETQQLSIER